MKSQGSQANFTGKMLENNILNRLKEQGYNYIKSDKKFITTPYFFNKVVTNHCYVGKSIYGQDLFTDLVIFNKDKFPRKLAIEIKWQQSSGSVDEKYPFLVSNIKEIFPCKAIIIIDGGGYKKGALKWLKNQVDAKLIAVFNISDFFVWINNGGL